MAMSTREARRHVATARVARLATVGRDGCPHVVPMVFALAGETLYSAVDHKPKRTTSLRRLANVQANPHVSVLVDDYDDTDWTRLWWVRGDGTGRVLEPGDPEAVTAVGLLCERYAQYRSQPPRGAVLAIDVTRWSGWSSRPAADDG